MGAAVVSNFAEGRSWRLISGSDQLSTPRAALLISSLLSAITAFTLSVHPERGWGVACLLPLAAAFAWRRSPVGMATGIILTSIALRLAFAGLAHTDPIDLAQAAAQRAFAGANPYIGTYDVSVPSGIPYTYNYGPLGLIWWLPGEPLELVASVGTMVLLTSAGAWVTLAAYAGLPTWVAYTTWGGNDYSVGFLLLGSLILIRVRPVIGVIGLAAAAAIKPYALAWFVPAIALTGIAGAIALVVSSLAFWAPVILWWGPTTVLASMQQAEGLHATFGQSRTGAGGMDIPILRWSAVLLEAAGILVSTWKGALLLGSGVYALFLLFSPWTHLGYWVTVVPVAGVAIELGNKAWPRIGTEGGEGRRAASQAVH